MTNNQIAFFRAKEEAKHWKRQDKLSKQQLKESQRHNVATESLTQEELGIKDWANRANVELGYTNAAINRTHYETSDAINQAHYQRSDANAERLGHIENDKLVLNYISTLGEPTDSYTLDSSGKRTTAYDPSKIGVSDYYNSQAPAIYFDTTPLSMDYLSPNALGNYGKLISGVGNVLRIMFPGS